MLFISDMETFATFLILMTQYEPVQLYNKYYNRIISLFQKTPTFNLLKSLSAP